jgi:hypothetical protein
MAGKLFHADVDFTVDDFEGQGGSLRFECDACGFGRKPDCDGGVVEGHKVFDDLDTSAAADGSA